MNLLIILISILSAYSCGKKNSELVPSSKDEFETGKKEHPFSNDRNIKKENNKLKLGTCTTFVNSSDPTNFYEYDYIGDLDEKLNYKIIRKTTFNGNTSLIIDMKSCKKYSLLGIPHRFGSLFVNFNESETTDRKNLIEIWNLSQDSLKKTKDVSFNENLEFIEIRFASGKVFLKDHINTYWVLNLY